VARSRSRPSTTEADDKKDDAKTAGKAAADEEKTPEQMLADKLELDRFVDRLRRKFH
jgi:hypothetical protein